MRRAIVVVLLLLACVAVPSSQTASTNKLTLTLQQLDSLGVPIANRQIGPVSYSGVVGALTVGNLANGANVITLPVSPTLQLYVKNLHTTNTITIIATPQGGASATMQVLGPGAVFLFWQSATAATYGITALTLTASAVNTPYELYAGG
jgi:hypothetical protein